MASSILALAGVLLAPMTTAAPSAKAKAEIARLIAVLGDSKCRFQRNGSWYDAAEARAHLQRKYDYLLKKNKVDTAEQFVERAASRSSLSGRPYRVKCGSTEQAASTWFLGELQRLRNTAATH
ncbi:hypothetical protein DT603_07200 [Pseudoxanthomonas gei]|uniref:DUF5329 domain-containing protein n=1 Tax=Pseudoxanthomonas gei TaxID=1383030 RepID=A0ABX0AEE8_9GAMM|nr:DUF5329 domain-containing protein [Pseudoxanthomonas gei]NDK38626.1 hypothetical protein [Pseudoxanthomonas gei]